MSEQTALTVVERAAVALGSSAFEKRLTELVTQSADIVKITNVAGYDQCHATRMQLKNQRVEIEKTGKNARDDATKFSKAVITEENRLIAIISPEEKRLEKLQKEWDDAREAEKQAKIKAEMERVSAIKTAIDRIRNYPLDATGKCSGSINGVLEMLRVSEIRKDIFEEFTEEAEFVKATSIELLEKLLSKTVAAEKEQERIRLELEELEKLRAEQQAREAEEQQRRLAENARIDMERKIEELRIKAAREAEEERIAAIRNAEQKNREREEARLNAEREAIAKERQALEDEKRRQEEAAAKKAEDNSTIPCLMPGHTNSTPTIGSWEYVTVVDAEIDNLLHWISESLEAIPNMESIKCRAYAEGIRAYLKNIIDELEEDEGQH